MSAPFKLLGYPLFQPEFLSHPRNLLKRWMVHENPFPSIFSHKDLALRSLVCSFLKAVLKSVLNLRRTMKVLFLMVPPTDHSQFFRRAAFIPT